MKHIDFSRGQFFVDDIQNLEFSYNMGELKIDVDAAKQKQKEKQAK